EDDAEAAFADLFQEFVRADDRAPTFGGRDGGDVPDGVGQRRVGRLQVAAELFLLPEQPLDTSPQREIAPAGYVEEGGALRLRILLHRIGEDLALVHGRTPRARIRSLPHSVLTQRILLEPDAKSIPSQSCSTGARWPIAAMHVFVSSK